MGPTLVKNFDTLMQIAQSIKEKTSINWTL